MKNLTTSIYDFEKLRKADYLYVDKTDYIWRLIDPPGESFFLSRPRRFGKSLLVSTLKAIFEGKKELFQGLAIHDKPYDWKQYPVIHLDMANCDAHTENDLRDYLARMLERHAQQHNVEVDVQPRQLASSFSELIQKVAGTSRAVILLDEYDKPILENISRPDVTAIRDTLADFYSAIKAEMDYEHFVLVTGVSKFSHVSLFSKLNNLTDITLDSDYAGMLGFTEEEVRRYFADRISEAAKANGVSEDTLMANVLEWYDGYRFSEADIHVCNPVSVSTFFHKKYRFSNYWDSTGTPSFLLERMQRQSYDHEAALKEWYGESIFSAYELDRLDITGLLWQTGYLTIVGVRQGTRGVKYQLGFPDKEVRETFCIRLLEFYSELALGTGDTLVERMQDAIMADDLNGFLTVLQSVFANIDYKLHIRDEKYYQTIFFVVFLLLGSEIEAESCTNQGRIDAYVRTAKTVFLFEFKLDRSPDEAVGQILDRRYYERFQGGGLPIRLVGVNFDSSKGRIDGWQECTLATVK